MNATDLRTLVDYTCWARDRLLDAAQHLTPEQYAKPMGNSFGSIHDTLVHIYGADLIWTTRIEGGPAASFPKPADIPDVASLRAAWAALETRMRAIVDRTTDADTNRVVEYKTLAGDPFRTPLGLIIQHVVNHGTHHRGQVVTMMRQLGVVPPKAMDLIFYYRDKTLA